MSIEIDIPTIEDLDPEADDYVKSLEHGIIQLGMAEMKLRDRIRDSYNMTSLRDALQRTGGFDTMLVGLGESQELRITYEGYEEEYPLDKLIGLILDFDESSINKLLGFRRTAVKLKRAHQDFNNALYALTDVMNLTEPDYEYDESIIFVVGDSKVYQGSVIHGRPITVTKLFPLPTLAPEVFEGDELTDKLPELLTDTEANVYLVTHPSSIVDPHMMYAEAGTRILDKTIGYRRKQLAQMSAPETIAYIVREGSKLADEVR